MIISIKNIHGWIQRFLVFLVVRFSYLFSTDNGLQHPLNEVPESKDQRVGYF